MLIHADRLTDRQTDRRTDRRMDRQRDKETGRVNDMAKQVGAFRDYANGSKISPVRKNLECQIDSLSSG